MCYRKNNKCGLCGMRLNRPQPQPHKIPFRGLCVRCGWACGRVETELATSKGGIQSHSPDSPDGRCPVCPGFRAVAVFSRARGCKNGKNPRPLALEAVEVDQLKPANSTSCENRRPNICQLSANSHHKSRISGLRLEPSSPLRSQNSKGITHEGTARHKAP